MCRLRDFREVRFSPDGRKVALRESKGNDDIWSYDLGRGTLTRVTSRWDNAWPRWAPDGESILYTAINPGSGVVRKAADGSGVEEILLQGTASTYALGNVSPDGQHLLYSAGGDIWLIPLTGDRDPRVLIGSEFNEARAQFSPDGKWIAYGSNESGRREIYVQPFPGSGSRTLISTTGGQRPVWRRDGRELFFIGENALQSVTIRTEPDFEAGSPTVLFERPNIIDYDVTPDGNRFLVIERNVESMPTEIHIVVNWFEELNRLVPTN